MLSSHMNLTHPRTILIPAFNAIFPFLRRKGRFGKGITGLNELGRVQCGNRKNEAKPLLGQSLGKMNGGLSVQSPE